MGRFAFSIAILGLIGASACETAQAAPLAPLPPKLSGNAAAAIPAHYYRHHYSHSYWRNGYPLAGFWNYYRTDWPGRGNSVESTR